MLTCWWRVLDGITWLLGHVPLSSLIVCHGCKCFMFCTYHLSSPYFLFLISLQSIFVKSFKLYFVFISFLLSIYWFSSFKHYNILFIWQIFLHKYFLYLSFKNKLSSHSVFPETVFWITESYCNPACTLSSMIPLITSNIPNNPARALLRTNTADPVVFTLTPPECFMEIRSGYGLGGNRIAGPVHVGDPITLLVYMRSGCVCIHSRCLFEKLQIPVGRIRHPRQWLLRP